VVASTPSNVTAAITMTDTPVTNCLRSVQVRHRLTSPVTAPA
jgi:hypothetical protein